MQSQDLKKKFLEFFKSKNHAIIPSSSLIPENDPTVLFTTAGMHPLVPYLIGQKHSLGKRLANCQKCLRTDDIEEVGDSTHLTFFEMLGNWSLGNYFKKESIEYSYEFLTKILKLKKERIYITCFKGDKDSPKDEESFKIWQSLGIKKERIFFLGKKDNWWGPVGAQGPCGPDTEIYYDTLKEKCSRDCMPSCSCGKYVEIWNNVFMQYNKTSHGYIELKQKNVDTGMGLERTAMILQNKNDIFETDLFIKIIKKIEDLSNKKDKRSIRIIADHLRASVFILSEKISPSNVDQGYILRRLIRRSIRHGNLIGIKNKFSEEIAEIIIKQYNKDYPELEKNKKFILNELNLEEEKFEKTLINGLNKFKEEIPKLKYIIPKELAFNLFTTYGFPLEMIKEVAKENNLKVDEQGFNELFQRHQEISRKGAEQKFKGGLINNSEEVVRMHTATHLLHKALRDILGNHVRQMGSNITKERLRFDFINPKALTKDEIKKVEDLVNKKIKENLEVKRLEIKYEDAIKKGALAFFKEKYPEIVSVYKIGDYSMELCGGPHVSNTKEIKNFKIIKEEAVSSGVRRIKAVVN
jgi:alanyl-tRNA synthetase